MYQKEWFRSTLLAHSSKQLHRRCNRNSSSCTSSSCDDSSWWSKGAWLKRRSPSKRIPHCAITRLRMHMISVRKSNASSPLFRSR